MKKQYDFSKGKRGAVIKVPRGKSRITVRLDDGRPGTGSTVHDLGVGRVERGWIRDGEASPRESELSTMLG